MTQLTVVLSLAIVKDTQEALETNENKNNPPEQYNVT